MESSKKVGPEMLSYNLAIYIDILIKAIDSLISMLKKYITIHCDFGLLLLDSSSKVFHFAVNENSHEK